MAQLNDLLVMGQSTLLGPINAKKLNTGLSYFEEGKLILKKNNENSFITFYNNTAEEASSVFNIRNITISTGSDTMSKDNFQMNTCFLKIQGEQDTGSSVSFCGPDLKICPATATISASSSTETGSSIYYTENIIPKFPSLCYGTEDLTPGVSELNTGQLYFVYEEVEAT